VYKQILIDGNLIPEREVKNRATGRSPQGEEGSHWTGVPSKKKEEEKEEGKESMLEVANCYLAEGENMYFDINLNPTFVSDDNAVSSRWMKFILEGT